MDITTKSVEELKALAYDAAKVANQAQVNVRAIEQEIQKREAESKEGEKKKK